MPRVILQEDVDKLGAAGEVVEVAPGYARNFLLPRKLALEATPGNLKRLEKMRAIFAKREASLKGAAEQQASSLADVTVTLVRKAGENGQLFGSVTSADIAEALARNGFQVDKRKVQLVEPIKLVGEYPVPVKLHREVVTSLKVIVSREE